MITTFEDFLAELPPPRKMSGGFYRSEWGGFSIPFDTLDDAVKFGPMKLFRYAVEDAVYRREPVPGPILDMFPSEKAERDRFAKYDAERHARQMGASWTEIDTSIGD